MIHSIFVFFVIFKSLQRWHMVCIYRMILCIIISCYCTRVIILSTLHQSWLTYSLCSAISCPSQREENKLECERLIPVYSIALALSDLEKGLFLKRPFLFFSFLNNGQNFWKMVGIHHRMQLEKNKLDAKSKMHQRKCQLYIHIVYDFFSKDCIYYFKFFKIVFDVAGFIHKF